MNKISIPLKIIKSYTKKQRNFCVNLGQREKKKYYNNIDMKIFQSNKMFWQRIKPMFSDKRKSSIKNISIIHNEILITEEKAVANKLNDFFIEAVKNLDIETYTCIGNRSNFTDEIDEILSKYESHSSILKIRENVKIERKFTFNDISPEELLTEISKLDPKKASTENDIPIKLLLNYSNMICHNLCDIYNSSKNIQKFPNSLKMADVIPTHKQNEKTFLKNYRPISLLPVVSKLFERKMYEEILTYIDKYLSQYIFGY